MCVFERRPFDVSFELKQISCKLLIIGWIKKFNFIETKTETPSSGNSGSNFVVEFGGNHYKYL